MGLGDLPALRSLPRAFVPDADPHNEFELPKEEVSKFRRVLRLTPGATIAILPNDGTLLVCELRASTALPFRIEVPNVEPELHLTLAQALPKGDKLDEIIRACTEVGVSKFVLFPSDRTVVRWEASKLQAKLARLATIAREAAEVSFRTRLPEIVVADSLSEIFSMFPAATVLSEAEGLDQGLAKRGNPMEIVVGPEGGWSPKEMEQIGARGVTLGPRVLRVEHAGFAAASQLLLTQ